MVATAGIAPGWMRILRAIGESRAAHPSYGPTIREVADASGYRGYAPVHAAIHAMAEAGYIHFGIDPHGQRQMAFRSLSLTAKGEAAVAE